ncbi:MAG: OmpH family outer membrane protein, partial [Planctomycetota bacterium]
MRHPKTIALFSCLAGGLLLALFLGRTSGQEGAPKGDIVFLNLKKVIDEYQKTKDMETKIDKWRDTQSEKITRMREELNTLREALKVWDRSSEKYAQMYMEYKKLESNIQCETDYLKLRLQTTLLAATKEIYEDIVKTCDKMREERGYFAIVKTESRKIESESKAELI